MTSKFYLIPFESDINEILRDTSLPDDIRAKRIVEALFTVLYPNGSDMSKHVDVASADHTHRGTQTEHESAEELVSLITPSYRQKARALIKLLNPVVEWDSSTYEIKINQHLLPHTNAVDLFQYLVSSAKTLKPPAEFDAILPHLREMNLPATVVNMTRLKQKTDEEEFPRQSERLKRDAITKWTSW